MMEFVFFLQAAQDRDRVLNGRFGHENRLETPGKRGILPYRWFIQFWNTYYGTAHFVVTLGVFILLYAKRADVFPQWRNSLAAMTALAIWLGSFLGPWGWGATLAAVAADVTIAGWQTEAAAGQDLAVMAVKLTEQALAGLGGVLRLLRQR